MLKFVSYISFFLICSYSPKGLFNYHVTLFSANLTTSPCIWRYFDVIAHSFVCNLTFDLVFDGCFTVARHNKHGKCYVSMRNLSIWKPLSIYLSLNSNFHDMLMIKKTWVDCKSRPEQIAIFSLLNSASQSNREFNLLHCLLIPCVRVVNGPRFQARTRTLWS